MKRLLSSLTIAFSLGCALFFCTDVKFPIRPEKVTISLLTEADEDSKTWEINEEVRVGAAVQHPQFVDSAYIAFGDGTDSLFHFGTESARYDTVWISHRYDKAGNKEIEFRVWIETLGEKGPVNEQIEIICLPAGLAAELTPSGSMAANAPFSLAVSCTGSVPLAYQWHEIDSGALGEENAATLRFASLEKRHAGAYLCVVTNPCGSDTSDTVAIPASLFIPPDTVGPAVTLISPSPDSVLREESTFVALEVTDSSGVDSVTINGVRAERNGNLYESSVVFPDTGAMDVLVKAWDGSDNHNRTEMELSLVYRPAGQDSIAPVISLLSPDSGAVVHAVEVVVRVKATDASGIDSVTVNERRATLDSSEVYECIVRPADTGAVLLTVSAWDASEQANSTTREFFLVFRPPIQDATGPVIALVAPSDSERVFQPTVWVKLRVTDASGVDSVVIGGTPATADTGYYHAQITLQDTGETLISVTAWDAADSANSSTLEFTLVYRPGEHDTQGPVIKLLSPVESAVVTNATIPVKVSATDPSGVAQVIIQGQTVLLQDSNYESDVTFDSIGTHTITVLARDASPNGNVDSIQFDITYDSTATDSLPPEIYLRSHQDGGVVVNALVRVSVAAEDPNGIHRVTIDGGTAQEVGGCYEREIAFDSAGSKEIIVRAWDAGSNRNRASLTFTLIYDSTALDTIAPEVTCVSHADGQIVPVDTVLVSVKASDPNGIASVSINGVQADESDGSYQRNVGLEEGLNTIECTATDASRNANVRTLKLALNYDPTAADEIPPAITPVQPRQDDVVSSTSVTVRVKATDENGIASVTIAGEEADAVSGDTYERTVSFSDTPGTKSIHITAKDGSSKANTASLDLEIVYDPTAEDTIPPSLSRVSPALNEVVSTGTVMVEVKVSDLNGVSGVTIDGQPAESSGDHWAGEVTLENVGINEIKVVAMDNSSNENRDSLTLSIRYEPTASDRTPPSISLASPTATVTQSPVTITVTVSDASGVGEVLIDNQPAAKSGTSYSRDLDLSAGSHDVQVYALDQSFNGNDTARYFSVTYDPPPEPVENVNIPSSSVTSASMQVTWQPSSADDFGSYWVLIGTSETSLETAATIGDKTAASYSFEDLEENTMYYVQVVVNDVNSSSAGSEIVNAKTLFLPRPGITLVAPSDAETGTSVRPTFDFHVGAGSGKTTTATLSIGTSSSNPDDITIPGLAPNSSDTDSSYFAYRLESIDQLDNGSRYYWKIEATVSDGNPSKKDTSQIQSFYTRNIPPSWSSSTYTEESYRNQTVTFSIEDEASLGVTRSGHELEYSLVDGNGSAVLVGNTVVWKRSWNITGDTTIGVCATDTWQYGEMSDTMTLTIGEKAQPPGTEGMRFIPAADSSYMMGQNKDSSGHLVTLTEDFWVDTSEVTHGDYLDLVGYSNTDPNENDLNPEYFVYYADAAMYCNARSERDGLTSVYLISGPQYNVIDMDSSANGYRLLAEEEWEYACRAGTTTEYYWGDSPDGDYANGDDNSGASGHWPQDGYDGLAPVCSFLPNCFGLYDMSGNLAEWTHMLRDVIWYSIPVRGGSHYSSPAVDELKTAARDWWSDVELERSIGFRCMRPVAP